MRGLWVLRAGYGERLEGHTEKPSKLRSGEHAGLRRAVLFRDHSTDGAELQQNFIRNPSYDRECFTPDRYTQSNCATPCCTSPSRRQSVGCNYSENRYTLRERGLAAAFPSAGRSLNSSPTLPPRSASPPARPSARPPAPPPL